MVKQLKFIKQVKDRSGFKHPVLVYSRDYTRAGNRVFKSISAAAHHIASLDTKRSTRG
jgi:hypothetical protein